MLPEFIMFNTKNIQHETLQLDVCVGYVRVAWHSQTNLQIKVNLFEKWIIGLLYQVNFRDRNFTHSLLTSLSVEVLETFF